MKVKEENEKVGLKLNIQKIKIMASGPITLWEIDGETVTDFKFHFPHDFQKAKIMASSPITLWQIGGEKVETVTGFLGDQKSLWMVTAAMKLKDACSLEGKL